MQDSDSPSSGIHWEAGFKTCLLYTIIRGATGAGQKWGRQQCLPFCWPQDFRSAWLCCQTVSSNDVRVPALGEKPLLTATHLPGVLQFPKQTTWFGTCKYKVKKLARQSKWANQKILTKEKQPLVKNPFWEHYLRLLLTISCVLTSAHLVTQMQKGRKLITPLSKLTIFHIFSIYPSFQVWGAPQKHHQAMTAVLKLTEL